jgi:hypothetical protein
MTHYLWIASHFTRWYLWGALIWIFAYPETGFWTALTLTLIVAGIEIKYLNPRHWTKS